MQRAACAVLLGITAGCSPFGPNRFGPLSDELSMHRSGWEAIGASEYAFVLRRLCFCGEANEPFRVLVRGDSVLSVLHTVTGQPPQFLSPGLYPTIDGLFALLQDAIERDAASIDATFDAALHYPVSISVDYDERIADEELGFVASDLDLDPP